jgi:hypothetical protein
MHIFPGLALLKPEVSVQVVVHQLIQRLVFNDSLVLLPDQTGVEDLLRVGLVLQVVFQDVPGLDSPTP